MPNYTFLDASSSVQTAASSIIGGINYPIVQISSMVQAVVIGNPSISGTVNIAGNPSVSGTVNTVWTNPSIVGTYGDNSAHTIGSNAVFTLKVRNDTLSSVTSADKNYSPQAVGQAGEGIVANAPLAKWVQGVASCFTGVIQPVIAAQGAGIFTYITSGQVANNSGNNVYLTFYGATSSVVGYLPVPANSGALPVMTNGWKSNPNGAISASVSGAASVFISLQGFISGT